MMALRKKMGMIEAHLGSCADCRRELEVIRVLRDVRPEVPCRSWRPGSRHGSGKSWQWNRSAGAGSGSREAVGAIPIFGRRRLLRPGLCPRLRW